MKTLRLSFIVLFFSVSFVGFAAKAMAAPGDITTVAGNGELSFTSRGGPAANAQLSSQSDIFVDSAGNIFIAEPDRHRIRRVDAQTGIITTVAGTGISGSSGDGGFATEAQLRDPTDIFVDASGNLFIADDRNHRIRHVDAQTGIITTVAGTVGGIGRFSGDGGPATETHLNRPSSVFVDGAGNLFIFSEVRVLKVDAQTGIITTVAGGGGERFSGDGGPATEAELDFPRSVFVDTSGNLFIADTNDNRIRRVDAQTGIITNVAGTGQGPPRSRPRRGEEADENTLPGNGGLATEARIPLPSSVFVDAGGNLFIADGGYDQIRRVDAQTGIITNVAGGGNNARNSAQ